LQLGSAVADSVLIEVLLFDEELDEALDVRSFPLEVAFGVLGGFDVGFEEKKAGIGEGPVFGKGELLLIGLDVRDYAFEVLVVADQFEGGGGADAFDGVEVVAAEEDAEVDELMLSESCISRQDVEVIPVLAPCPDPPGPCPDEFPE
jgi:hypothetical protein